MAPECAIAYNNRAWAYYTWKKYQLAIKDYNQAIELKSDLAIAYYNRGLYYSKLGEYAKSISDFSKSIKHDSGLVTAYHNRGWAYYRRKKFGGSTTDYNKAIKDFTSAIIIDPEYYMSYYGRGAAYMMINGFENAVKDFSRAVEINKNFHVAYHDRGKAYYFLGYYQKAIDDFTKAIENNPKWSVPYYSRGGAYARLKQFKLAIKDYTQARELKSTAAILCSLGGAYEQLDQFKNALDNYNHAIELDPFYCRTYNSLGRMWLRRAKQIVWHAGDLIGALAVLSHAIALKDNYASAYFNRGEAFREVGLYQKAVLDYGHAIDCDRVTHHGYCTEAEYFLTRGWTCVLLGKMPKALDDYQKGLYIQIPWLRPAAEYQGRPLSRIRTLISLIQSQGSVVLVILHYLCGR